MKYERQNILKAMFGFWKMREKENCDEKWKERKN